MVREFLKQFGSVERAMKALGEAEKFISETERTTVPNPVPKRVPKTM